jgi:hypothetical protein
MYDAEPIVGNWYHHPEKAQKFKVVDVNSETGDIELQYFDGTVDEIDYYLWGNLGAERIEAPEDWTGPMDKLDEADLDYDVVDMQPEDWAAPYDENREKRNAGPRNSVNGRR